MFNKNYMKTKQELINQGFIKDAQNGGMVVKRKKYYKTKKLHRKY